MDPLSVLHAVWRQRWFALPALLVTLLAAGYMYQYGPREYESTMSYALVNPDVPTEAELEADPELAEVNSDNPYLRSSNPTLITDVVLTRLTSQDTADALEAQGLGPEYTVAQGGVGNGFVLEIIGSGPTPQAARDTKAALGDILVRDLRAVQEVNGADPSYHFSALLIADSEKATERFSSRLRTVIALLLAGGLVVFASVSFGEWVTAARGRRRRRAGRRRRGAADPSQDSQAQVHSGPVPGAPREPEARPTERTARR